MCGRLVLRAGSYRCQHDDPDHRARLPRWILLPNQQQHLPPLRCAVLLSREVRCATRLSTWITQQKHHTGSSYLGSGFLRVLPSRYLLSRSVQSYLYSLYTGLRLSPGCEFGHAVECHDGFRISVSLGNVLRIRKCLAYLVSARNVQSNRRWWVARLLPALLE